MPRGLREARMTPQDAEGSTPTGPGLIVAIVATLIAASVQWFFVRLISALSGGNPLSATDVLVWGGGFGALCLAIVWLAVRVAAVHSPLKITAGAAAISLINLGLMCRFLATPAESDWYSYSAMDRDPKAIGLGLIAMGVVALVLLPTLYRRLLKRAP